MIKSRGFARPNRGDSGRFGRYLPIMKPKILFLLILFLCALSRAKAQDPDTLRFAKIISDNMVLQQQKPITLWGWAKPKATVKITLTQDASLGQAAADKLGKTQNAEAA